MAKHALHELIGTYYDGFADLKEKHEDEGNLSFQQSYGLVVQAPKTWPVIEVAVDALNLELHHSNYAMLIYSSTQIYQQVYHGLSDPDDVYYLSWHEIYVAMGRSSTDARELLEIKRKISSMRLIVFLGASSAYPEVVDQIRMFCSGCLILLN